jgi:hypothetical protein
VRLSVFLYSLSRMATLAIFLALISTPSWAQQSPALAGTGSDLPPAKLYNTTAPLFSPDGTPIDDRVQADPLQTVVVNTDLLKYGTERRTSAPAGTIEVIYFFWYGSPWAARVDQSLRAWASTRSYPVRFVPYPVIFAADDGSVERQVQVLGARIFFALQLLDKEDSIGPLFMTAVHRNFVHLDSVPSVMAWMEAHGITSKDFLSAINDPKVRQNTAAVPSVVQNYMDKDAISVPAVAIDGSYLARATTSSPLSHWLGVVELATDRLAQGGPRP